MISKIVLVLYSRQFATCNSAPHGQNGRHFADDLFRWIFLNETFCILIPISLKFVPNGPMDNYLSFSLDNDRIGDKPLSESMLTRFTDAYMQY